MPNISNFSWKLMLCVLLYIISKIPKTEIKIESLPCFWGLNPSLWQQRRHCIMKISIKIMKNKEQGLQVFACTVSKRTLSLTLNCSSHPAASYKLMEHLPCLGIFFVIQKDHLRNVLRK